MVLQCNNFEVMVLQCKAEAMVLQCEAAADMWWDGVAMRTEDNLTRCDTPRSEGSQTRCDMPR